MQRIRCVCLSAKVRFCILYLFFISIAEEIGGGQKMEKLAQKTATPGYHPRVAVMLFSASAPWLR
jgi:hypothetical protein